MNYKKILEYTALFLIIVVIGFSVKGIATGNIAASSGSVETQSNVANSGEPVYATLKMVNYEYVIDKPLVVGREAILTVDLDSVYGCMRDVVMSDFGVRKYVKEGDNKITFTPDKAGTFKVVCSMNMGRGEYVVVEDSSASLSAAQKEVDAKAAAIESNTDAVAPSCGGSGSGSCGGSCGGGCGGSGSGSGPATCGA